MEQLVTGTLSSLCNHLNPLWKIRMFNQKQLH